MKSEIRYEELVERCLEIEKDQIDVPRASSSSSHKAMLPNSSLSLCEKRACFDHSIVVASRNLQQLKVSGTTIIQDGKKHLKGGLDVPILK